MPAPDTNYDTPNYRATTGEWVIGGELRFGPNATVTFDGAQAAAITAVPTTGATNTTPYGFTTAAQANDLVAAVNSILTALQNIGVIDS